MLVIPTQSVEDGHILLPWVVGYSIFGFLSWNGGKLTFTQRSLPTCADLWLLLDALITVKCTDLWSLPLSELPPPDKSEPPGQPLGILGALCDWHHLPHPMTCWAWESPVLLTSQLDAPLSRPCIKTSTLQASAEDWIAFPDPCRCPSLHLLFHDNVCNSLMALLNSIYSQFYQCCPPSPINWTCQAESNIPCTSKGESLCVIVFDRTRWVPLVPGPQLQ